MRAFLTAVVLTAVVLTAVVLTATTLSTTAVNAAPIKHDRSRFSAFVWGRLQSRAGLGSVGISEPFAGTSTGDTIIDGFLVEHGPYFGSANVEFSEQSQPIKHRSIVNNELIEKSWTFGFSVDEPVSWASDGPWGGTLDIRRGTSQLVTGEDWSDPPAVFGGDVTFDWWIDSSDGTHIEGTEVLSLESTEFEQTYRLPEVGESSPLVRWHTFYEMPTVFDGDIDGEPLFLMLNFATHVTPYSVPEPSSFYVFGIGTLLLAGMRRNRTQGGDN